MVHTQLEAQRPASHQEDAKPPAELVFTMKDGPVSLHVFAQQNEQGEATLFAVPRRVYRGKQDQPVSTHILHQDDLFRMGTLLMQAYSQINMWKKPTPSSQESASSDDQ